VAGKVLSAFRHRYRAYVEGSKRHMREVSAKQQRFALQQQAEEEEAPSPSLSRCSTVCCSTGYFSGQGGLVSSPLEAGSILGFLNTAWK
jgi:hypothetical protein